MERKSQTPRKKPALVSVGRRIAIIAAELGITQEDMARDSGISLKSISNLYQGRQDPRLTTLAAIANTLGVPVSKLIPDDLSALADSARKRGDQLSEIRRADRLKRLRVNSPASAGYRGPAKSRVFVNPKNRAPARRSHSKPAA